LPQVFSNEIRTHLRHEEEGWGRLKTKPRIKAITWDTAIWYDTKKATYLLPIKSEVRKKEAMQAGYTIIIDLWL